jgi:TolB-like protein
MAIWSAEIKELEKLYGSLKGQLPDLEKELERLVKADDENIILLYSRRCLEVIINNLCESELMRPRKTEPLKGIIDKLHKEEKVPSHIITSMHGLNELSTYGAHPKDFDPEQVKPVLNNLSTIIKWYLKYKETGPWIVPKPAEEIRQEIKSTGDVKKDITISRKRLAGILGGLIGIIASVFAVLYFARIIGESKPAKEIEKSIAVLPFRNLSNDTTQLYFSEGVVEAILDHLFKVGELKVISSTSTKRYRDTELSIKEIAIELGVASILEGTVQKIGNNVRITTQLIEAKTDIHLWSETYDKNLSDIFSIQTEVAQNVARELKATLTSEEKQQIMKNKTENPEAYNLYLQGRYFWNKRTEAGLKKSIEYFKESVLKDPDYAIAYAGLADAYFILSWWGYYPRKEGYAKAKELSLHALELDKNLAEAHATLGSLVGWSEWKWEESKKELLRAIELNPNYAIAHSYYSELLDVIRENNEARKQINLAMDIDPFFPMLRMLSASYYYHEGKYKESANECIKVLELDPDYVSADWYQFYIYIKLGEDLKAVEVLQKIMLNDSFAGKNTDMIKTIFNSSGIIGIFNWLIEVQHEKTSSVFGLRETSFDFARWYAMLHKNEEALNWLEKALKDNPPGICVINNNPDFDNMRLEPRFQAIIKKMGLSEYQTPK